MPDLIPEILYEDEDILAINKPAGLVVHSDGRTKEKTVADWFVSKYPEAALVGEPMELKNGETVTRPGIVHRIDRDTSGVLLLAKSHAGHALLKEQFQDRAIDKVYHAFLYGSLKDDHGTINLPITKSATDFRKWSANRGGRGEARDAVTYYQVLKRTPEVTLVEAKPKTGRTHQIRVHFKAMQRPVVGDQLYAKGKPGLLGFKRLALHARSATFTNHAGKKITVVAPYPEDFKHAMDSIGYAVLD